MDIDAVNYSILKVIRESEGPLWKNRIHELLMEQSAELPDMDGVSVQTVGRRVDRLRDDGYLDSCIISPDDIKRDLIIAFQLTNQGEDALTEKESDILKETVQNKIFGENEADLDKPALVELIRSQFDLEDDVKESLMAEYDREELLTLMTMHYVREQVVDVFSDESAAKFADLARESEAMSETFGQGLIGNDFAE